MGGSGRAFLLADLRYDQFINAFKAARYLGVALHIASTKLVHYTRCIDFIYFDNIA